MIPVLFFTDIFIFLFNQIVKFLNDHYPPVITTSASPEYEIPVYLVMILVFILLLAIYHKLTCSNLDKIIQPSPLLAIIKMIVLFFLGYFFINQLGTYPMREEVTANRTFIRTYLLIILTLIIGFSLIFAAWKKQPFFYRLFWVIIVLLIAAMTFFGKFPIYFHDYSFFFGPIIEIAKGKTIFSQVYSRYSFLLVLLLGYLGKFSLFNPVHLPVLVWLFYSLQYFLCFYLILKISDSVFLALISLFSLLTINYYSLMHIPIAVPQIGAIRWLPHVLSLFFLYHLQNLQSKKFILILALLSFFTIDSGVYLIIAYGLTLFVLFIFGRIDLWNLLKSAVWLLTSMIIVFMAINLVNLGLGYRLINIGYTFKEVAGYVGRGNLMIPIGEKTFFWITLFLYFLSLNYYLTKQIPKLIDNLLLFSANLMIISNIYFVGRSHSHSLLILSVFVILNISIFLALIVKNNLPVIFKYGLLLIFFFLLIVYPALARNTSIKVNIDNQLARLALAKPFEPEMISIMGNYQEEVDLINRQLREKKILLISPDDIYLFYLTNKTNFINTNLQQPFPFGNEPNFTCPKKFAIDCRALEKCSNYITLNSAHNPSPQSFDLEKDSLRSRLNFIKNRCRFNSQPTSCTERLCIVQAD